MPNPPFELTLEALDALAIGAWILGTGGGGDPYFSLLEAREQLAAGKRARVIDPLSLADDALVACVGQMGAPLVKQERLVDGPVIASTITMMEEYLGRKFEAVMLWEIGGNNGFQAILSGMLLDLPIVDCDAMGRAFPQADMTTFSICELTPYPWTMVDIRRNRIIFAEAEDWSWMERMTRRACTVLGSSAATCKAPRTGAEVKSSTCLHTLTQALRIGRTVVAARRAHEDAVAAVVQSEGGLVLFRGKIVDVMRRTTEGWLQGHHRDRGARRRPGPARAHRFPERVRRRLEERGGDRHRAGPDLPDGQRLGRCDRHGDGALRAARHGHRPAGAGHPHERAWAEEGRPAGLRLRSRFPFRVRGGAAMMRIGIDVGGTNTDAVMIEAGQVRHAVKSPTTADVTSGISHALADLLGTAKVAVSKIGAVMIGTTHFTNAVVQRRDVSRAAAVRIGLPAAATLPPFVDWPADLRELVRGPVHMIRGGYEVDGRPLVPFDRAAMRAVAQEIAASGVPAVAVSCVFSPLNADLEREAGQILREECPGIAITLSHELGRIGLLARENVSLLNASLHSMARATIAAFTDAIDKAGIAAPLFITQNDGTVVAAAEAVAFPVRSFASGPTNSLRGAAFLSGLENAIVVDVGGTTADVGSLRARLPARGQQRRACRRRAHAVPHA